MGGESAREGGGVVRSVVARAVAVRVVVNKVVRGGLVGGIGRWGLLKGGVCGGFVVVVEEEEGGRAEGENMVAMEMEKCVWLCFFLLSLLRLGRFSLSNTVEESLC